MEGFEVREGLGEQVWGTDGNVAGSGKEGHAVGPPDTQLTPRSVLRLPDSGPVRARLLVALASSQGVSGALRTPGSCSLAAIMGAGRASSMLPVARRAACGPAQLWEQQ